MEKLILQMLFSGAGVGAYVNGLIVLAVFLMLISLLMIPSKKENVRTPS